MSVVKKIINTFMHNPMPDDVQNAFARWILSGNDMEQKNKALEEEWNAMCESSQEDSVSSVARWSRLRRIHRKMEVLPPKRKGLFVSWGAVAACAALVCMLAAWPFLNFHDNPESEVMTCYVTSSSGKGEFSLPDGSRVWLNSDSRLEFKGDLSGKVRKVNLYGEAFFDVMPAESFFVVNMGGIDVKVLGTEFNARNSKLYGDYEITLKSGKVQVESERFAPVSLVPGQQFVASANQKSASVRKVNTDNYTSWTGDVLTFDNRRLDTVVINLEHWFNVDIDIDPAVDASIRISLAVRHESLSKTLDLIKTLVGCDYAYSGEGKVMITE